jgi:hypothetical protein
MPAPWTTITLSLTALLLATATGLASWKMFEFHNRLCAIEDNGRREAALGPARVMLFGDSQVERWPMAVSFGAMPVVNRGVSGDWATRSVERFVHDFDTTRPKTVVILIGTNDLAHAVSPADVVAAVDAMATHAGGARLILCSVLPSRGEYANARPVAVVVATNALLRDLAARRGATYLDLYSQFADAWGVMPPRFTVDGLHLSADGYLVASRMVLASLESR